MSWKIKFSIKKFYSFEDNIELIKLIDDLMIHNDFILYTNFDSNLLLWSLSFCPNYDYFCELNSDYINQLNISLKKDINKIVINIVESKFKLIETTIKNFYQKFGLEWYIDYKIS